jgi:Uma2 family endonuclease
MYSRVEIAERMTAAEFLRDAPEDRKAELIDGVMIVPSPALDVHERLFGFLYRLLSEFVELHDLGLVRGSRTAVILGEDQAPAPDLLFVAKERLAIVQEKAIFGAPDLVVEILSASTLHHDRGAKFRAYERAGVGELWLIDPYGPEGTAFYQRQADRLVAVRPDGEGRIHAAAVPGFWVDVAWLWPADRFLPLRTALAAILRL